MCHTCWDSSEVGIVMRQNALPKVQQFGRQRDCLGWVPGGVEGDASSLLCCKLRMRSTGCPAPDTAGNQATAS